MEHYYNKLTPDFAKLESELAADFDPSFSKFGKNIDNKVENLAVAIESIESGSRRRQCIKAKHIQCQELGEHLQTAYQISFDAEKVASDLLKVIRANKTIGHHFHTHVGSNSNLSLPFTRVTNQLVYIHLPSKKDETERFALEVILTSDEMITFFGDPIKFEELDDIIRQEAEN